MAPTSVHAMRYPTVSVRILSCKICLHQCLSQSVKLAFVTMFLTFSLCWHHAVFTILWFSLVIKSQLHHVIPNGCTCSWRLLKTIACHWADPFLCATSSFVMSALSHPFFLQLFSVFQLVACAFLTTRPRSHTNPYLASVCLLLVHAKVSWQLQPSFPLWFACKQSVVLMPFCTTLQASVIVHSMHVLLP